MALRAVLGNPTLMEAPMKLRDHLQKLLTLAESDLAAEKLAHSSVLAQMASIRPVGPTEELSIDLDFSLYVIEEDDDGDESDDASKSNRLEADAYPPPEAFRGIQNAAAVTQSSIRTAASPVVSSSTGKAPYRAGHSRLSTKEIFLALQAERQSGWPMSLRRAFGRDVIARVASLGRGTLRVEADYEMPCQAVMLTTDRGNWLEAMCPRHRLGPDLNEYFWIWRVSQTREP